MKISFTSFKLVICFALMQFLSTDLSAQAVDLTIRRVAPTHGLEVKSDNYVFVEVSNRALSNVNVKPTVNLEIHQGRKVKIMKGKAPMLNAANNYRSIVQFIVDVKSANPDVEFKAVVNPGRTIGETNHRNNSLRKTYSVKQDDWVGPSGRKITAVSFLNGTWGMNGNGTYKEIPSVKVRLYQGSQKISEGWTDSEGRKSFNDVPPGTYKLRASKNGYLLKEALFSLGSSNKTIKLGLRPG